MTNKQTRNLPLEQRILAVVLITYHITVSGKYVVLSLLTFLSQYVLFVVLRPSQQL